VVAASPPLSLTPFIGRDSEVDALRRLLDSSRLLTLTGAGGSGKTRLASEVAARSASRFADGVAWVELAPLGDPELLPTYLLDALGIEHGARPPMTALLDTLRERQLLLVLDNCEHLVDACATIAEALLRGCPRLHILATSREALGVTGERAWLVPGLSLPAGEGATVASIGEVAAVQLFVDRAQAAVASFTLTPGNAAAVAQICRRLDGLPLAIELAAARVKALPPEELATRLDDTFRVLTASSRTAVPRHRTLREAIDWSYNLLHDRERALLQRLAMFAGDFTLHAAESVGADADLDAADVLDTLGALVDKSLVVMREVEGTARFYLLETIRQYAAGRLRESGNYHQVCDRHARAYMALVAEAARHFITRERPVWVQRVQRELDNIRVALACTRDNDPAAHLELSGNLGWFWYSSGLWSEGRRWLEGAIALPAPDKVRAARASVLLGAGVLASLQGDTGTATTWLDESAALYRALHDRSGAAYANAYLGVAYGQRGDPRAVAPLDDAIRWFRHAEDLYGLRLCLVVLATYHSMKGEAQRAREQGEEAVQVARAFGLDRELAIALQVLAGVRLTFGDLQGAGELLRESVAALRRDPSLFWQARALQLLALVNFGLKAPERGAYLMGASEAVREMIGAAPFRADSRQVDPALAAGRAAIGDAAFDAAWKEGRADPQDVVLARIVEGEGRPQAFAPSNTETLKPSNPEAAFPLEVRALGALEILRDGARLPDDAWRYARPRELLLFLLSHPEGRTREQIGLVFWPDASATQVKNNFHVMLHHVRKAIGRADLIAFERERYRIAWELGVRFDARELEEAIRAGIARLKSARRPEETATPLAALREAFQLYRGEFLAEEGAGDWHVPIRDRLRRLYADALLLVGERTMELGSHKEAAEIFRLVVQVDELHEEAHRRLMLALARGGERSEALKQYDRLARSLRSDLDAEPDRETKALYDKLRRAEAV
jgi:predicted ATPase/DNA-binding SARP family transcriptional activator